MKKLLLTSFFAALAAVGYAQYPVVSVTQINQPVDLSACNDTSVYYGDTVTFVATVVTDGGLSEVASSSVIGGNRPFIFLRDSAATSTTPYNGIEMMPIYENSQGSFQPVSVATQLIAGDIIEVTGIVGSFESSNQITTLDANSITIVGSESAPTANVVPLSDFNDANRVNQITTGEPWEGAFVELQNVTVTSVIPFGNGRISFDVSDANGNTMNVSDRFLAQRTSSHQVVNPNSPAGVGGTGSFVPPVPGTFYNSLSGIIRHSANGCTGATGRGYEINPFDDTHYNVGFAPPFIDEVERDPVVPNAQQDVDITATIIDSDGTVDTVRIGWSTDPNLSTSAFPTFPMTLAIGSTEEYEFTIPQQANGTIVRYYIYSVDNQGNKSIYPSTPVSQSAPNYDFYTVRQDGLTINDVQFSLTGGGDSPYLGREVTVKGVVTASARSYDLGYVYIQDPNFTEYAGVALIGSIQLADLYRNEWVEVTGDVQESFGFTQIAVSNVTRLYQHDTIQPTSIDPSDSTAYANGEWEKYEGMLVKYENPGGGKIYITDEDAGFGDYRVATDASFGNGKSSRVLAGRQSNTSASSLWVQLVTDTVYETQDGTMFLSAVTTSDTMTMDAIVGPLYYGFSNYRVLPRANDDIMGLNASLDMTINRPSNVSLEELQSSISDVQVYPNPSSDVFTVSSETVSELNATVYDLNGKVLINRSNTNGAQLKINASTLPNGIYLMQVADTKGNLISTHKVVVRK
jgi:hypothetical protein